MARILVVDDERSTRDTLQRFLTKEGHTVLVARDAEEAAGFLAADPFDVVVTDIVLPRVDGVALLRMIREAAPCSQVILMTGAPTVETAAEAVRAGAADYLLKPVCRNAILRSVGHAAQVKALADEKSRLEEVNHQHQENLERLVDDRTHALRDANLRLEDALAEIKRTQRQVIQQERMKALGQMVGGIAHDFNNVLMPILGFADFLLSSPGALDDREEVRETLGTIRSAAADAKEIVRRLREFYRPEEDLDARPVDLADVAKRVLDITEPIWRIQAQAAGRDITVAKELDEIPPVLANRAQVREVLTNLVINAVQAIPGSGEVRLAVRREEEWGVISVTDTGTGMSEDLQRRCFEPFFTTKGQSGSGLGLSVCHGIVKRHRGRLEVSSEVGKGTTMTVRLPIATREQRKPQIPSIAPQKSARLRVLVIEDDRSTGSLLTKYLTTEGHRADVAEDGESGIARFREASPPYDLVITDRSMPGMSGDAVAAKVKEASASVPVIMLTGFGDLLNEVRDHPPHVDLLLGKPVTQQELNDAISRTVR